MKILLGGLGGHMGRELTALTGNPAMDCTVVRGVDIAMPTDTGIPCVKTYKEADGTGLDCLIDFSFHTCTEDLLSFALREQLPAVIATTGQTDAEREMIVRAGEKIPIFFSGNMSLGVALLCNLAKQTAAAMPGAQIEIVEAHHIRKKDAPSGSAKMLFEEIKTVRPDAVAVMGREGYCPRTPEEIGIHSLRMGNVVGQHSVIVATEFQTITLKHEAHSRVLFAEGAIHAAHFLMGKAPGLYNMFDMIQSK